MGYSFIIQGKSGRGGRWLFLFYFILFLFLGSHLWHLEVPKLGVQLELQLPAYTTATEVPDPSCFQDPHLSSQQPWILNPLSGARDRTCNLMVPSRIHFHCAPAGTPRWPFLSRCQAYIISSSFIPGKRVFDPMRSHSDCHGAYSNQQKGSKFFLNHVSSPYNEVFYLGMSSSP